MGGAARGRTRAFAACGGVTWYTWRGKVNRHARMGCGIGGRGVCRMGGDGWCFVRWQRGGVGGLARFGLLVAVVVLSFSKDVCPRWRSAGGDGMDGCWEAA